MIHRLQNETHDFVLLGSASALGWELSVERSEPGDTLWLEIDSPRIYLTIALTDLAVLRQSVDLLQRRISGDELFLGHFSSLPVVLQIEPNLGRVGLLIGPRDDATLRYSLAAEETAPFATAMQRLADELAAS